MRTLTPLSSASKIAFSIRSLIASLSFGRPYCKMNNLYIRYNNSTTKIRFLVSNISYLEFESRYCPCLHLDFLETIPLDSEGGAVYPC